LSIIGPSPSCGAGSPLPADWEPDVQVALNAVRQAGTAFAVQVDGGCVFGAVHDGELTVDIGGYINDGGCLATYAQ
jgi:hypothetical protein